MKIFLTGVTGYVGRRLLPVLLQDGHEVTASVRDPKRFTYDGPYQAQLSVKQTNFAHTESQQAEGTYDVAFYLIHSMGSSSGDFEDLEKTCAINFLHFAQNSGVKQVVYLGGLAKSANSSKHLRSRQTVFEELQKGSYALTTLRAGVIVGSGSSSFEIIRDLVEKLPLMVCPKWVNTKTQPIASSDVIKCLKGVLGNELTYNRSFDIGSEEVLSYKKMMQIYGDVRKINTIIITVPVLTPRLSSYWLYFVTASNYRIARDLVNSMKIETVCDNNDLFELIGFTPISYRKAIENAFSVIAQNGVISSWKDSFTSSEVSNDILKLIHVPEKGCFKNSQVFPVQTSVQDVFKKFWSIGGKNGWYYGTWMWQFRGLLDKMVGGVGLRRGRRNQDTITTGDSLDFWRVILADEDNKRLILYAEMKVPGEAWLEFKLDSHNNFYQTATFRPRGLWGRIYWWMLWPFHKIIFSKMAYRISLG